jgi:hypothetical protein
MKKVILLSCWLLFVIWVSASLAPEPGSLWAQRNCPLWMGSGAPGYLWFRECYDATNCWAQDLCEVDTCLCSYPGGDYWAAFCVGFYWCGYYTGCRGPSFCP